MAKLTLVGTGRMARAVARVLSNTRASVHAYAHSDAGRDAFTAHVEGVPCHRDLTPALEGASLVFLAVAADALAAAAEDYSPYARGDHIVLTATRGVGDDFALPHAVIRAKTCARKIGYLGGPIHARELEGGRQINLVLASKFGEVVDAIRGLTAGAPIAIHRSSDILGVEIAGAIANVGSIASGMASALDLGDTARGVLLTHCLVDATRLGLALGASSATFSGLAGVGELIPREVTSMNRHVELGHLLGEGRSIADALKTIDGHVEGIKTAQEAMLLAKRLDVGLVLVDAVHEVLSGHVAPRPALEKVLHQALDLDQVVQRR